MSQFSVPTAGKTSRENGASLDAKISYPKAAWGTQANIAKVKVKLPKQLPSRLTTLQKACTDTVFNINPVACPAPSRVGTATTTTPILPVGSFELKLPLGHYSALAANGNLCKQKLLMPTRITAQNGAVINQSTKIAVSGCGKAKQKAKSKPKKKK